MWFGITREGLQKEMVGHNRVVFSLLSTISRPPPHQLKMSAPALEYRFLTIPIDLELNEAFWGLYNDLMTSEQVSSLRQYYDSPKAVPRVQKIVDLDTKISAALNKLADTVRDHFDSKDWSRISHVRHVRDMEDRVVDIANMSAEFAGYAQVSRMSMSMISY